MKTYVALPERGHEICWYAEARHAEVGEDQVQQDQVEVCPQLEPRKSDSYTRNNLRGMEGERGNSENVSALSAGAYTTTWLMMVA